MCGSMGRVREEFSKIVEAMNSIEEARKLLQGWDKVLQFEIEGEEPFYLKVEGGEAKLFDGKHEKPDLTFKGPEEVFYKMATGELDPTKAYMMRKYQIVGPLPEAIKFGRVLDAVRKAR
ncbi:MAG: hypothetical protein DRN96_09105 [Thermoproteota archaeon]|nr:MAG: hypothetical protein DRN96_09105 [Candidatus Korarchaeota archaeon]